METYGEGFESLSEENQLIIKDFDTVHQSVLDLADDSEEFKQISDKNGMKIYTKANPDGGKYVKAEGVFDFPASLVADYASDSEIRLEVDKTFKEAKIIEEIGCGLGYEYSRMKGTFIVSDRDFCTVRHRKDEDTGRIIISAYSKEHPDCPLSKAVRGEMRIFGYVITPNAEDEEKCYAQLIMSANLCGSIPTMFANKAVEANGKFLHKLNKKLKADAAE
mmetsp:Transcript_12764/g.14364  ORF Transcript_12764/g.14364 Transcript_12764/m.14364 type:complete len:220 (+) Transcript_12764:22-681(+)